MELKMMKGSPFTIYTTKDTTFYAHRGYRKDDAGRLTPKSWSQTSLEQKPLTANYNNPNTEEY